MSANASRTGSEITRSPHRVGRSKMSKQASGYSPSIRKEESKKSSVMQQQSKMD